MLRSTYNSPTLPLPMNLAAARAAVGKPEIGCNGYRANGRLAGLPAETMGGFSADPTPPSNQFLLIKSEFSVFVRTRCSKNLVGKQSPLTHYARASTLQTRINQHDSHYTTRPLVGLPIDSMVFSARQLARHCINKLLARLSMGVGREWSIGLR